MKNPQRITSVKTEVVGDNLAVFDRRRDESHVLNSTAAFVWQHCDGQTSTKQLATRLQKEFNLSSAQAGKLMKLALVLDQQSLVGHFLGNIVLEHIDPLRGR